MKLLYGLMAVMFFGLLLMAVSSYQVMTEMQKAGVGAAGKAPPPGGSADAGETKYKVGIWVATSYVGIALFAIGGIAGLVVAFQLVTRRF